MNWFCFWFFVVVDKNGHEGEAILKVI